MSILFGNQKIPTKYLMKNDLGVYIVNGVRYTNKIQAILEAQKTLADISWEFHNEKFNQIDWSIEPELSLESLYRIRAQQIRDNYDYVILMCSGGADSTNALNSFLDNNIHVDEIIAGAPMSGLKSWDWSSRDKSVENTISETMYALFPLLEEVAQKHPNVKITLNDYFENIINFETDKWIYDCQDWVNPAVNSRASLDKFKHLVDMADAGKRIAVVWGIDKPILKYMPNGDLITMINDLGVNNAHPPFQTEYPNVDRILFYWSPDLPELLVKQSHVLAKYIHKTENLWLAGLIKNISNPSLWTPDRAVDLRKNFNQDYQRAFTPAIYPSCDMVFQCHKSGAAFMPEQHYWFNILHKDTRIYQLIDSDFKLFYKSVNPMYLNSRLNGFKKFYLKFNIGHYRKFLERKI
jgi:hypothetical protein